MEKRIEKLKPFPEVKVIAKLLDPSWAAQYRERARPPRIEFGMVLLSMPRQQKKVAIYHELGHWLRCEHLPRPNNGKKGEEAFAEEFASYMLSPSQHRGALGYSKFDVMLNKQQKRKIDAFGKRILRDLEKVRV